MGYISQKVNILSIESVLFKFGVFGYVLIMSKIKKMMFTTFAENTIPQPIKWGVSIDLLCHRGEIYWIIIATQW